MSVCTGDDCVKQECLGGRLGKACQPACQAQRTPHQALSAKSPPTAPPIADLGAPARAAGNECLLAVCTLRGREKHLLVKVLVMSVTHGRLDGASAGIPLMRQAAWRLAKLQETGTAFPAGTKSGFHLCVFVVLLFPDLVAQQPLHLPRYGLRPPTALAPRPTNSHMQQSALRTRDDTAHGTSGHVLAYCLRKSVTSTECERRRQAVPCCKGSRCELSQQSR